MSIFRMPTLNNISTRFEGLRNRLGRGSRLEATHQKMRHLTLDPLEERQLLSVSPADYTDVLVNQTVTEDQISFTGENQYGTRWLDTPQAMAMDDDGDFVVTWTRYDPVVDEAGDPIIDPMTQEIIRDANIYARYFTDDVQRISLPDELAVNNVDDELGTFTLKYGGNEVQKLTISATHEPVYSDAPYATNIAGGITLGFDLNGNGNIGVGETATIFYDERDLLAETATQIETALQGLGGALSDVTVKPVSATEFEVHFGDDSLGENQPMITVEDTNFTAGFLPAVQVEALREPIEIGPIAVSPDDPSRTATSIEEYFRQTATRFDIGPILFQPENRLDSERGNLGPYTEPVQTIQGVPTVSVTPIKEYVPVLDGLGQPVLDNDGNVLGTWQESLTDFEITFDGSLGAVEGAAGKKDHPELVFVSATTDSGLPVTDLETKSSVHTIKEPSPEFRVNPEELDDPYTPLPDKFDQTDATVAMDADGNFVIVWTSEIPEWEVSGSLSDVFARQFTPVGNDVDGALEFVPGIMAMGDTFQVNTTTPGMQGDASVGMDDAGNFTIAWGNGAQDLSYFNSVRARNFDRDYGLTGEGAGEEFLVNREDTSIHFNPYVAVSHVGDVLITWMETDDEDYVTNSGSLVAGTRAIVYDANENVIMPEFGPGGFGIQRAAFDKTDSRNFVISWESANDLDNTFTNRNLRSGGVRARAWELYDQNGNVSRQEIRSTFAVNSADFDPDRLPLWPMNQGTSQPLLDADGDLTILYDGFGPDVQDAGVYLDYSYFEEALADPANDDLLPFLPTSLSSGYDVDNAIEMVMISAANNGATLEQLGRIRAILDKQAGLLRGEANGIMYSQFDADPTIGSDNILFSDSIANAERDGHNEKYILAIDRSSTGGNFEVRVSTSASDTYDDITISPVYNNQILNVEQTRQAIETALRNSFTTGTNWPWDHYRGPITVRTVKDRSDVSAEILAREVTLSDGSQPWAYPWSSTELEDAVVYEITFQGEVHDQFASISIRDNDLSPDEQNYLRLANYQNADSGITQYHPSADIEPDGDFTTVWIQREEHTTGTQSNQNIYYRRFDESTDTAGPRVTDLIDHDGNRVDDGATINGAVRHVVVTFDEALMADSVDGDHSVLNPNNWILSQDGISIVGAVVNVEFGLNKASELSGTYDGFASAATPYGEVYELSDVPTNKWEAVLTIDGDGSINTNPDGNPERRLGIGTFEITALSDIHDTKGNPLQSLGPVPGGRNVTKTFAVYAADETDSVVDEEVGSSSRSSGTLHPETPNAVAVDADGDYVMVWTSYDSTLGHDRVYWRQFDADGTPADLPLVDASGNVVDILVDSSPVLPVTAGTEFQNDIQRNGSVAIDPDGDFVITWTNYSNGDADIYARSFPARGVVMVESGTGANIPDYTEGVSDPFQVNDYTQDEQKWSDVAMDREGNYVITWTSYAQELNGDLGSGYGVYARRYDSEDRALAGEFQVNVTTAGDQQTPSIAMGSDGTFVIAWTSDQNGTDDDIIVREFDPDGSPKAGPLSGERRVNDYEAGNQRYPDVAMRFDSLAYVVTWTDTAADISGTSVWAELSSPQPQRYLDPFPHLIFATHNFTINVGRSFTIADLNVQLGDWYHARLQDLQVILSHGGESAILFANLPRPSLIDGTLPANTSPAMYGTVFDDEAPSSIRITETDQGAIPPYNGTFVSQDALSIFDGLDAQGTWTLTVIDQNPGNGLTGYIEPINESIGTWNLDITEETQQSPDSFRVNSTTIGHQMYSSVAMDTYGNFTVTWSGQGEENQDTSGHGVYYQRYDRGGTRIGRQTLTNLDTDGDQWISSVGMDARGNFVIAWTGEGALPETNAVYKYDSINNFPRTDNDGPIVTDVYQGTQRILSGGVITELPDDGIEQMTVVFNERLSVLGGEAGLNSVLNPNNWAILRNDQEIVGGVTNVDFQLNPLTNKFEATVTFDANGVNYGESGLKEGEYTLTVRDLITDTSRFVDPEDVGTITPGNYLDGDFDGQPGSQPITIGLGGYEHKFSISASAQLGPEFRINEDDTVPYEQRISAPGGLGQGQEESNKSVAVDHDGDFAVVWTTYGLDDPTDVTSGGVYMRLYDRENNPLTGEILVNQNVTGHQRNASIAMDADGDFVIVWESEGTSLDGSWDIFARRFDSMGRPVGEDLDGDDIEGDEFQVNSTVTDNQLNPTVAMDDRGAFVIGWATAGQDFSFFNDVYGQRYDRFGVAQGSEFRINENDLPGATAFPPGRFEINPAVTMSGTTGNFVFAWEVVTAQQNGVATNTIIAGRTYDADGGNASREFRFDSGTGSGGGDQFRVARNPQLAMNDQDEYTLVWESYSGGALAGYDVYYREYRSDGQIITSQVNMAQFSGHQVNPSVAVDADGDFSIVWNGPGATVDPLYPNNPDLEVDRDDYGVFKLDYNAANQTVNTQHRVNRTEAGPQYQATIGMEPDGDSIVVWSGTGVGDSHGIFARRYNEPTDTAGPTVSDWTDIDGVSLDNGHVFDGDNGYTEVRQLVLVFDEDMLEEGDDPGTLDYVTNPDNYALLRGGISVPGAIVDVQYGLNPQTNKYEATLTFDGDLTTAGLQPLEDASYQIQALAAVPGFRSGLRDVVGNVLYRTGLTPTGQDFTASFVVQIDEPPPPPQPDPPSATEVQTGPVDWDAVLVNQVYSENQFTTPGQSLAVDNDGDFVVTWTRYDDVDNDGNPTDANIYARYFTDEVQRLSLPSQMAEDTDGKDSTLGTFTLEYDAAEIQMLSITAGIQPFTSDDVDGAVDEDEVGTIEGSFVLGYDLTGDGTIGDDPGVNEVVTIRDFSETSMEANAQTIQDSLQSLGGALAGVTVRAINPRDYMIEFADATAGLDIPEITVESLQLVQAYLPAVTVTTQHEGLVFEGIRVSQDNPLLTAQSIENAIRGSDGSYGPLGPVDFPPPDRVSSTSDEAPYQAPWWTSSDALEVQVTPVITPDGTMSLTDFDITFIDSSGKQDHPELLVTNARNDQGQAISIPSDTVTTRKESSNEFRVNPEEYDDPTTSGNDAYNQTNPAVAMDADGDFVIVWESEIPDSQNFGSVSDVFARRFAPFGKTTDAVPGEVTDIFGGSTGVRELVNPEAEDVQRLIFTADNPFTALVGTFRLQLDTVWTDWIEFNSEDLRATADDIEAKLAEAEIEGVTVVQVPTATTGVYRLELRFGGESAGVDYPEIGVDDTQLDADVTPNDIAVDMTTIQVNQNTANPQFDPAVAMDESGAFVVSWANGGQTLSYFNHISVQRFSRAGERLGNEFQVNAETTSIQFAPSVALSNSGNFLVTWSSTDDVEFVLSQTALANVRAKVFDSTGSQLVGEFSVGGGGVSMAAFDADDNYIITWHGLFDSLAGVADSGVHARQFALYDSAGQPYNTAEEIRSEFRINSSAADPDDPTLWPYHQWYAQPAIDADGDLTIIYEGYGPDVSVNVSMAAGYFSELMGKDANQDLWVYFDPFDVYERGQEGVPVSMLTQFLGNNGDVDGSIDQVLFRATELGATTEQLGRLRSIMEQTVGQLRGEANGVMVSQWDTDPNLNSQTDPLFSDSVINSYRDGQNQRSYLEIPMQFSLVDSRWYQAERGTFTVQVTNLLTGQAETAVVDISSNGMGQPLSIEGTRQNLETALENMAILGDSWANEEGAVDIREIETTEILDRTSTDWEIDEVDETLYEERSGGVYLVQGFRNILYEVEFQGSAHDTPFEIEVISSATERGGLVVANDGTVTIEWVDGPPVGPAFFGDTYGTQGTEQTSASIGMEPDGDYTALYTQIENYRNAGFVSSDTSTANSNIYYRRFDETTDTAGPRVTDWADASGVPLEDDAVLQSHLQYAVMTFDEEMLSGDPAEVADSILNTANFKLSESNAEISDGIINVAFGLSKAAELAGQIDPLTGLAYDLDPVPSNKWEAVITFDGDPDVAGAQPLRDGFYSFEALASVAGSSTDPGHSGLRDRVGNTLYHTGYDPAGADFQRSFSIKVTERKDEPVNDPSTGTVLKNAHTHPESPGAIAADADGHYAVVWTATDSTQGDRDKIYYRLFDADGTPADLPVVDNQTGEPILGAGNQPFVVEDAYPVLPLTPSTQFPSFALDTQGFATVAMDKDGDFVVTWTNYDYDASTQSYDANIYARRMDSMGEVAGVDEFGNTVFKGGSNNSAVSDAFAVNSYTDRSQKWSNVAMDVDGDFIVTWSSYGQEDGGQLGSGYGVYARRYDSFGQPMGSEFQVNITEAGNQQFSNVAMDSQGGFTIAWTSDQNGISDDIIVRDFNSDGTPVGGPLGGEIVANQTLAGDQRYPDIDMNLAGDQYVVTWSASGQDGSGWGVYGRLFNRSNTTLYVPSSPALSVPDTGTVEATLNVSNNAIITDLNVRLELQHASPSDLEVHLISPNGTDVELFTNVPRTLNNGNLPQGSDFSGTLFDDDASVAITNPNAGAVPPFAGTFQPTGDLADFNGENVNGQWRLRITDSNGNDRSGVLEQWSLIAERSPVTEQEFRVNTTSIGNQTYSSVAMDHQGEFVVTWSGFGNQPEHEDLSGSGVFLQRFEATGNRIGDESRVNMTTEGDQTIPSVSSDGVGNYYVAFTGVRRDSAGNNIPGETDVYVLASNSTLILQDNDPPIVTDVQLTDGTRLLQGDVVAPTTDSLLVIFGESLSLTGMSSVENAENWTLERNGNELNGVIESVDFRFNATTRKYEAELTLSQSSLPLGAGEYQLTASSVISDNVNSLDGDLDGIPGSNPTTTTQPGYQFRFNVSNSSSAVSVGAESRVNQVASFEDRFSAAYGTGTARETSNTTLAVDHDGDYVVVWTRYGADEDEPHSADVFMRLFNREDEPLTDEIQVNKFTTGHQRNPSVAMDADGDFIVVWESIDGGTGNLNVDGSYDVYARRFSAAGTPLDFTEYRVNTELTGHQVNPAVAMDDAGNFAIVWATAGQDFSFYNDVKGQMFRRIPDANWNAATFDDFRVGTEFLANSFDIPGVGAIGSGGFEINPAVAMGGITGDVVVAWEVVTAQQNGVVTDTEIAARLFSRSVDGTVTAGASEFAVGTTGAGSGGGDTQRVARNPQLTMDDQDGFFVVWESYTGTDYDVFYEEYTATGGTVGSGMVNMGQFAGQQVNPSVAVDADGDFAIVWNGNGAHPDPLAPTNSTLYASEDSEGIWIRSYDAANETVSVQSRVNIVGGGIQQLPTIGMEPDGDSIVAWNGRGVGDQSGIFVRRYDEATDTAGPRVTELRLPSGELVDTDSLADPLPVRPNQLLVIFDEELRNLSKTDPDSVENVENWRLERAGVNISSRITNIEFALDWDEATQTGSNKWEAIVTFDSPLEAGQYNLEVRPPVPDVPGTDAIEGNSGVRDVFGNPLGQNGLTPGGQTYSMQFRLSAASTDRSVTNASIVEPYIAEARTHFENPNSVAVDADGDYVVVLTALTELEVIEANGARDLIDVDKVYFRTFDANGEPTSDLLPVTAWETSDYTDDLKDAEFDRHAQRLASVATDSDGDFVVTWTNYDGTDSDIYARRFYADGTPMGRAFLVNAYTEGTQVWSDVAMDIDGDFIITWSSDGQEQAEGESSSSGYGVYARRYDSFGSPLSAEFRVNLSTAGDQRFPSVAMDAQGGYYVVWTSNGNGLGEDIIGRSFYSDGSPIPIGQGALAEQSINTTRTGDQSYPDVAMNLAGNSVIVTWSSANQDGDGWGVFGRVFNRNLDPTISGQQPIVDEAVSPDLNLDDPYYNSITGVRSTVPAVTTSTLTVTDSLFINDLNVGLTLSHPDPRDLDIYLISPAGTRVQLVDRVPRSGTSWNATDEDGQVLGLNQNGFIGTIFDDEGDTPITDTQGTPAAVPPFTDVFIPEERLRAFDGESALGTWTLEMIDYVGGDRADLNYPWVEHGAGTLQDWSLSVTQNLGGREFQVNETSEGNQVFSSVATNQAGDFVIAWSGRGDREFEEDESGVFYRRYDLGGTAISTETLVNYNTEGRQWMPSVGSDAVGNFVVTYTSEETAPMNTDVYMFRSQEHISTTDETGPLVTDVLLPLTDVSGNVQSFQERRLIDGDSILTSEFALNEITILFSEEMALQGPDGRFHPGSVENTSNWSLSRNGTDIPLAITNAVFSYNEEFEKYQAVLTLDGNGAIAGTPVLDEGEYVLTAWNTIHDAYIDPDIDPDADPDSDPYFGANPLSGNFDLGPSTSPGPVGTQPFTIGFQVIGNASTPIDALVDYDGEIRVNTNEGVERFSEPMGTGQSQERSGRTVAIDDDGDLAVVWTRYLSAESSDAVINEVTNSSDVYLRLVDRDDNPLTTEILVNEQVGIGDDVDPWRQGTQRNVTVAMDADGDLIVVWESEQYRDKDGNENVIYDQDGNLIESSGYDIWARRFDAMGNPIDNRPFRVNLEIGGDQTRAAVDMDDYGNSIVVWGSRNGDEFSYFTDLYGQRYDVHGDRIGTEFQVNELSLPGTSTQPGSAEANPAVALHETGSFVVTWEQTSNQVSGVSREIFVVARGFNTNGTPLTDEFRVDDSGDDFISDDTHQDKTAATASDDIRRSARNPQIAMDSEGNYIIVWESFHDNDVESTGRVDSFGIYFREFYADHTPVRDLDHQANLVITTTDDDLNVPDPNVNSDKYASDQVNPSIGVDADGDFAIVWNGNGATAHPIDPDNPTLVSEWDREGVFARDFHAGVFDPNNPVPDSDDVYASPQSRVNRTEGGIQQFPSLAMEPDGDYVIAWSGAGVGDRQGVYYRRYQTAGDTAGPLATELRTANNDLIAEGDNIFQNPTSLKVIFNEEMSTSGGATGYHSVLNPNNWALIDGRGNEMSGAISSISFGLNAATNKWEAELTFNTAQYPAGLDNGYYILIARTELYDAAGNALARTGLQPEGTGLGFLPPTSPTGGMGFSFRIHELTPGDPSIHDIDPIVNTNDIGNKVDPAIARNADGRYVVVWTEEIGTEITDPLDPDNTLITFSTEIYARIFQASADDSVDEPVLNRDGSTEAFLVNSLSTGDQITADVAIDADGEFVVVWSGVGVSGLGEQDDQGIFGQRFRANGDLIGGQFGVNQTADGIQEAPAVAMDAAGDFVVTWQSHEQGGIMARKFYASGASTNEFLVNSTTGNDHKSPDAAIDDQGRFTITWAANQQDGGSYGVFAQRYAADASRIGGEFQINQFTANQQEKPRIAMDDNGAFVIAWQSFGQDASGGYGIYARRYGNNGVALNGEFLVNETTTSYQFEPAVAMDSDGDFVITWSGFGQEGDRGEQYGIFAKMYNADGSLFVVPGQTTPLGEFRINAIVEGDQRDSDVAMDADGHYVVVWEGSSEQTLLVNGQFVTTEQTDIYARFVDPPVTLSDDGKEMSLTGTPSQDTFEFVAGATPGSWAIKVNGEVYTAASTVETINFDGMGGDDIVTLTGTDGAETVTLRPGEVTFVGSNFTINATNVEDITVNGRGGADVATLYGSSGDDVAVMQVDKTTLTGPGFSNKALKFEEVYAYSNGGVDEARLYDTDGNEVFTGTPEFVRMEGDGFMHRAKNFRYAHGYSSGGNDRAELHDSEGDDKFKHYKGQSKMFGKGFYVRAKDFPNVDAIADAGGDDYARIFDTDGVDKFVGTPTSARMYSKDPAYDVTAELFEKVLTYARNGGNDIARFYATENDKELFSGHKNKAVFYNDDFEILARKFEVVQAHGKAGSKDLAKLRDTTGDDHLVIDETSAKMYEVVGNDMELLYEVFAFDQLKAYHSSGNDTKDVANSVIDTLIASDGWEDV